MDSQLSEKIAYPKLEESNGEKSNESDDLPESGQSAGSSVHYERSERYKCIEPRTGIGACLGSAGGRPDIKMRRSIFGRRNRLGLSG